jgi:hypothetical protein
MLSDRIVHESISILEEKLLRKQIKDIEEARSKVIYLSTNRAKLQDTVEGNEATQVRAIPGFKKEPNAFYICVRIKFHTYDRQYNYNPKQYHNEREYHSTLLYDRKS